VTNKVSTDIRKSQVTAAVEASVQYCTRLPKREMRYPDNKVFEEKFD
jgi:hypothetical protein